MQTLLQSFKASLITDADLAPFSRAQLNEILSAGPSSKPTSHVVIAFLKKYGAEVDGLSPADLTFVSAYATKRDLGIGSAMMAYEETVFPKGGDVSFTRDSITLTGRDGTAEVIPNLPLPAPSPPACARAHRAVMWLFAFFDIDAAGNLQTIRDATIEKRLFGAARASWDPLSVAILRRYLEKELGRYSPMKQVVENAQSITGMAAMNFWYNWVNSLTGQDLLALHHMIIRHMYKGLEWDDDGNGMLAPFSKAYDIIKEGVAVQQVDTPGSAFMKVSEKTVKGAKEFAAATKVYPLLIKDPLPPRCQCLPVLTDPAQLLAMYKESVTLRGGNSRGVGYLANFMDYCPRQSEVIRRLNFFVMAVQNIAGPCDIHAKAGDVSLLVKYLSDSGLRAKYVNDVRVIIPHSATKGIKRTSIMLPEPRGNGIPQIAICDWLQVPDVSVGEKKKHIGLENIQDGLRVWFDYMKGREGVFLTPVFHPDQFDAGRVFQFGYGHDLMAIYSTTLEKVKNSRGKDWLVPTCWRDYIARCREGMRYVNCWPVSGIRIYGEMGTFYRRPVGLISIVDGEWSFEVDHIVLPAPVAPSSRVVAQGFAPEVEDPHTASVRPPRDNGSFSAVDAPPPKKDNGNSSAADASPPKKRPVQSFAIEESEGEDDTPGDGLSGEADASEDELDEENLQ